jgi:hypothetical protein
MLLCVCARACACMHAHMCVGMMWLLGACWWLDTRPDLTWIYYLYWNYLVCSRIFDGLLTRHSMFSVVLASIVISLKYIYSLAYFFTVFCCNGFVWMVRCMWQAWPLHLVSVVQLVCPTYAFPHSHSVLFMPYTLILSHIIFCWPQHVLLLADRCIILMLLFVSSLLILPEVGCICGIMAMPVGLLHYVWVFCLVWKAWCVSVVL